MGKESKKEIEKADGINVVRRAVCDIKSAILQSQLRVASAGNRELLMLYFGIGKYISLHSRHHYWGTGAIEKISESLQKEMPGLRGFSAENIKRMRSFYENWGDLEIRSPVATELDGEGVILRNFNIRNNKLNEVEFCGISFSHHMEIINKTSDIEARIFYIHHAYTSKWNKYTLREMLKQDLYHKQGALPNNFARTIPDSNRALKAIEMFKDEYLLDFMNVEELNVRDEQDVDERMLEQQIVHNVKNFIMTFGRDFTFVGNQYHLEKFGHDLYPDLLFYNRELACLVAVELKAGDFKPAYLGQLNAYLRVLDDEVKKPFENPSIGIILCKNADKTYVEYLIQGYTTPMGVATYRTREDVLKLLPSEEELRNVLAETPTKH